MVMQRSIVFSLKMLHKGVMLAELVKAPCLTCQVVCLSPSDQLTLSTFKCDDCQKTIKELYPSCPILEFTVERIRMLSLSAGPELS